MMKPLAVGITLFAAFVAAWTWDSYQYDKEIEADAARERAEVSLPRL